MDARERETVVVVLNCKTSNSKREDEDTEKLDDTITALVLAATGRDTNRWGDERSLRRLLMREISPPRCGGQFSCLLLRVLSTSGNDDQQPHKTHMDEMDLTRAMVGFHLMAEERRKSVANQTVFPVSP